jgi:adenosylhomocysteine nucleosidase
LPRLLDILSGLGSRARPQSVAPQSQHNAARQLDGRIVLAITGMKAEARIAAGADVSVIASGGKRELLESALDNVFEANVGAVLSFGIAGGLAPGLRPGTALVARSIIAEDGEQYECDRAWSQRLAAALGGAPIVDMAGIDDAVTTPADKRALHIATRAAVADMESHIAARFAAARNLPFAAFRVVADPAERHVPPAALAGIGKTGCVTVGPVLRSLARAPGQFPHLVKTAFDANAAFLTLFRGRQMAAGGGFGFFDFGELVLDMPREDVIGGSLPV